MVSIEEIIGDIIFISFREYERYHEIGIEKIFGHYVLKGYDRMGIWLEHPGIIIQRTEDEQGSPLPVNEHSTEDVKADFLVQWDNINTIMHYPDREGFDYPSQFNKQIGFKYKHENHK